MTQFRSLHSLLDLPAYLRITDIGADSQEKGAPVTLNLVSRYRSARCPLCQRSSRRVHSHYQRTLADLPIVERNLTLRISVRRFFCSNPACVRRIFAEQMPDLTKSHARRTQRQRRRLEGIELHSGGRAGARMACKQGLPISFKTLLRFVVVSPCPQLPTPRVLGVDDWAFRKGHRYGTILYDLQTHQPVDLLPDRTAQSLSAWLKAHPGVEIISGDRASAYSQGARQGGPNAVQVADRFHLLKNLGDALERLLNRKRSLLKEVDQAPKVPEVAADPSQAYSAQLPPCVPMIAREVADKVTLRPLTQAQRASQRRRLDRYLLYEQVRELYGEGYSISQIARQMQGTSPTIRKFIRAQTFPERTPRSGDSSQWDTYKPYLRQRWQEGCHNACTLWKEVRERGYWGGYTMVKTSLHTLRHPGKPSGTPLSTSPAKKEECSVRDVVTALMRPQAKRSAEETSLLDRLDHLWDPLRRFRASAQAFIALVRAPKEQDQSAALKDWIAAAQASEVSDMMSFAAGIKKDMAAVIAGLSLAWNNGPVEGSVNRLKMIKRQMYGRAGFPLLRRRVLEPT